jgi:diguanylate cyclase (GGDEF)-like protein
MNLTQKIRNLVLVITVLAGLAVTVFVANREFAHAQRALEEAIATEVPASHFLPDLIEQRDTGSLRRYLVREAGSTPLGYAAVFEPLGQLLVQWQNPAGPYELANLAALRAGGGPTEVVSRSRWIVNFLSDSPARTSSEDTWWLSRLPVERVTDVTVPILSERKLSQTPEAGGALPVAQEAPGGGSLHVVGYVNAGISHARLWWSILPVIGFTFLGCAVFVFLAVLAANRYGLMITGPLSRLAIMAEKVAAGEVDAEAPFRASGEARYIADMLNTIIGEFRTHKMRMQVDRQLLNLQVSERTKQLSRRDRELSLVEEEVTRTREDLRRLAYLDSLTGLPNRRLFTEQLNLLLRIAERNDTMLALLFLDLDNFKRINDSLGHSAGDLLLREVALRLSQTMRESDVISHFVDAERGIGVSRLGGDEFTVVLNDIESPADAGRVAERLFKAMAHPIVIDGHEVFVTPSIGIAIGPRDATDVEGLLKAADAAMYHAKASGRNSYLYYENRMGASNAERLQLETDLRRAIEREQLVLHYQPQVDVTTGSVVGVEALIRWQHPEHGLIPPTRFIPLAEESGMIVSIGEWALMEACRDLHDLRERGLHLPKVSVNCSALAFSPALVDRVRRALDQSGVDPSSLELELTEGVMMDCGSATIEAINQIKSLGVDLSIDDFGTGYSSLSYLSHFPLDGLKLDRSFVVDFDKNERSAALAVAIVAMAHSLKVRLVAEGVETPEQLLFLWKNGVTLIQGYLLSKPLSREELAALLEPGYFRPQIRALCMRGGRQSLQAVSDLAGQPASM